MRGSIFAEGIGSQRLFGNYVRVFGFLYTWVSEDMLGRELLALTDNHVTGTS